ncbi:chromosome segregation SMC family protein [Candidatus Solirubrobacter pratensis]|uniref:chromosome segregation SMC family protein n=1 Tax=Candidatus Solirubrobacter pratensis TaxID=1298857 RepID=UPI00040B9C59|nr:AAA family ATPase [Candidatus Solirubrobacter pratensis]
MHLSSISLKGFKSFPDRTRLTFTPGVSVIVGPNGSGKSNITDAVLWAMGEQSPVAVRGQSMQDVIFAGAHGVQARAEAEVEVVLDNASGKLDLPVGEVAISRRLNRAGEGEYRINGARCRLADVIEILSDTGLGKEMHSVVSQGRVSEIVTSKPRDRRLLIEEAAGLGKHRKRRRRAQIKLERTQDNLDRALDVEREARTRLKPLKRQAEAAELHERIERQSDEARWTLARDSARSARAALSAAEAAVGVARAAAAETEAELAAVGKRREAAEEALSSRGSERESLSSRFYAARSAGERIGLRLDAAERLAGELTDRAARRRGLIAALEAEAEADTGDDGSAERIASLEAELAQLAEDYRERLERELEELEARRDAAAAVLAERTEAANAANAARGAVDAAADAARRARRELDTAAERARRESARIGAELAKVNQFLRSHAGAPGGAAALADTLTAAPGYELALAAALGPRLRAAVAADLAAGAALLDRAGKDGAAALILPPAGDGIAPDPPGAGTARDTPDAAVPADPQGAVVPADRPHAAVPADSPPAPGAVPLSAHVRASGDDAARRLAAAILAGVWVVEAIDGLAPEFRGIAVTRDGRVWSPATRELRQVNPGGEDRVLTERNRRDALLQQVEAAAQAERAALNEVEAAQQAVAEADAERDAAERESRAAARARDEAAEAERHARWVIQQRRSAPDEGATAERKLQVEAAIATERRLVERAERERKERRRRLDHERRRLERDEQLRPVAERFAAALKAAAAAIGTRVEVLEAELNADRAAGEKLASELRECAAEESRVHAGLKQRGEEVTRGEVKAQQARDQAQDAEHELTRLAAKLGLEPEPAGEALADTEREGLATRIERLQRRREQLGPVNPLAQQEYKEALAHVEELERQREDLETALRELQSLIKDTDKRIREAFEETFEAAAKNFEEVAAQLFPGGRGRLRLVREDSGPRPVLGGADAPAEEPEPEDFAEGPEDEAPEDKLGVEIEITPAGKSTKRLTLLSGGEKSMTALAFLFAVFLARPCPFYILDEVEAALDDLNIDRFLTLLRSFSDRAQFIVVTHQKRTMEAADCLYGVSMAGNGVSKVISRRLGGKQEAEEAA